MPRSISPSTRHSLTVGTTQIEYELVRSKRKTLAVRVFANGRVQVRAPLRTSQREVANLIASRIDWILKHQARFKQRARTPAQVHQYVSGEVFYFLGRPYRLKVIEDQIARVCLDGDELVVGVCDVTQTDRIAAQIKKWYRVQAERIFTQRLDVCFSRVATWNVARPEMRVRHMRSRWGSCSAKGRVTMNVRLVQASEDLIDYVLLHELCHLKQMNHSRAFWALMDEVLPEWRERRKALNATVID